MQKFDIRVLVNAKANSCDLEEPVTLGGTIAKGSYFAAVLRMRSGVWEIDHLPYPIDAKILLNPILDD